MQFIFLISGLTFLFNKDSENKTCIVVSVITFNSTTVLMQIIIQMLIEHEITVCKFTLYVYFTVKQKEIYLKHLNYTVYL